MTRRDESHPIQEHLIKLLLENADNPLTIREMQELLGVSSKSVVAHHLKRLEKRGLLKRNPHNPRDYHVIESGPERQFAYVNLYGLAQCGPDGSILDGNPIDRVAIPSRLLSFPSVEAFLVQAKGDSMAPRINDGDLLIARRTDTVDTGRIIVCVNNGEALIKRLQREPDRCILVSSNPSYLPFSASADFRIVGEVKAVMSHKVL